MNTMTHGLSLAIVALAIAASLALSRSAPAQCVPEWLEGDGYPGTDGKVYASTIWDPDADGPEPPLLVIGGDFTIVGTTPANNIAAWDGTAWRALGTGITDTPSTTAAVWALAAFDGDLIVGGAFETAGGQPAGAIARWNGASWSALPGGIVGTSRFVHALGVHQGDLIVGGQFDSIDGVLMLNIARWDGDAWHRLGGGLFGAVMSVVTWNSELVAAGTFPGTVSKWNGASWTVMGSGLPQFGRVLHVHNNELLVGGGPFPGGAGGFLRRWTGNAWQTFPGTGPALQGIQTLLSLSGDLIVGGGQSAIGGTTMYGVARWDGTSWLPLGNRMFDIGGPTVYVSTLALFSGQLIAGGKFERLGDEPNTSIAAWHDGRWRGLNPGLSEPVQTMAVHAGTLYTWAPYVGYLRRTPEGWWVPARGSGGGLNGSIKATTEYNGELVASGRFSLAEGVPANNIARWNGESWLPIGEGLPGAGVDVFAVTVYGQDLIAAGSFQTAGGQPANRIARWDGLSWSPLGSGLNATATALAVYGPDLIVAGQFATAGGIPAARIARWDGASWSPLGAGLTAAPSQMIVFDGGLVVNASAVGLAASSLSRWNGVAWQAMSPGVNNSIYALHIHDGSLFAAGAFTSAAGQPAARIARWTGSTWTPLASGVDNTVFALASFEGSLIAAGNFLTAGGRVSPYLARWGDPGSPSVTDHPDSITTCPTGAASFTVAASGTQPLTYLWRRGTVPLADGPTPTGAIIFGAHTPTLTIAPASSADAAAYDCIVSNTCGHTTSAAASLFVCAADADCDRLITPSDVALFLSIWFTSLQNGTLAGDFDGNGQIQPADVSAFVTAWFAALNNAC